MKLFARRTISTLLLSLSAADCSLAQEKPVNTTEHTILRIAERHIATQYPDFDSAHAKPVVKDLGDKWEITYELPEDMIGGVPVVLIDKHSSTVVRAYHTQ